MIEFVSNLTKFAITLILTGRQNSQENIIALRMMCKSVKCAPKYLMIGLFLNNLDIQKHNSTLSHQTNGLEIQQVFESVYSDIETPHQKCSILYVVTSSKCETVTSIFDNI